MYFCLESYADPNSRISGLISYFSVFCRSFTNGIFFLGHPVYRTMSLFNHNSNKTKIYHEFYFYFYLFLISVYVDNIRCKTLEMGYKSSNIERCRVYRSSREVRKKPLCNSKLLLTKSQRTP